MYTILNNEQIYIVLIHYFHLVTTDDNLREHAGSEDVLSEAEPGWPTEFGEQEVNDLEVSLLIFGVHWWLDARCLSGVMIV